MQEPPTKQEGAESLCLSCGFCCDGTIFDHAIVESAAEISQASKKFAFSVRADGRGFNLPCPAHDGARCCVYDVRPPTCRGYKCITLKAYLNGEARLETARAVVEHARARIDEIAQTAESIGLPVARHEIAFGFLPRLYFLLKEGGEDVRRKEIVALALRVASLRFYLTQHFAAKLTDSREQGRAPVP